MWKWTWPEPRLLASSRGRPPRRRLRRHHGGQPVRAAESVRRRVGGRPKSARARQTSSSCSSTRPAVDVRVGDVATVRVESDPAVIRHESVATYLDVTADVSGRDVRAALGEIDGLIERVEFPLEHHAELLGGFQEQQTDRTRLIGVAVAAVIAIFLLLQGALRSWRLAILSFCTLPLALAGGVVAALLAGGTLTIGSIAGLLAVVGIAARAVVLLIRRYHDLERAEDMAFGPELIIRGTREDSYRH